MGNLECQSFYYGNSRLFVVALNGEMRDETDVARAMKSIGKSVIYSRGNKIRLIIDFSSVREMTVVGVKGFSREFAAFARKVSLAEAFAYCGETMKINLMLVKRLCKRDIDILPSFEKCMARMMGGVVDPDRGGRQ